MIDIIKKEIKKILKESEYIVHETKRHALIRYITILVLFIIYLSLMIWKYGITNGILVSLLTWSFFVLCTPIADAGFLFDFPVRIITGMRMVYSEVLVWVFAIVLNIIAIEKFQYIYNTSKILEIFYTILTNPVPYWIIILVSAFGTFLSITFGDELLDVMFHHEREKWKKHKIKYHITLIIFLFIIVFLLYGYLIEKLFGNLFI